MRWLLACLVLFAASVANAGWHERLVEEKYQIKVYPALVWERCDHGSLHAVQPAPYWEERTRTVQQVYWVDEPIVYSTTPVYSYPQYIYPQCVCPQNYSPPICYPAPIYYYGW
jgi:23S rRNA-/tRNA-specific pseudouridylate synthase